MSFKVNDIFCVYPPYIYLSTVRLKHALHFISYSYFTYYKITLSCFFFLSFLIYFYFTLFPPTAMLLMKSIFLIQRTPLRVSCCYCPQFVLLSHLFVTGEYLLLYLLIAPRIYCIEFIDLNLLS